MLLSKSPKSQDEFVTGIITVINWTLAPDGHRYIFFWAKRWQIITDADIPIDKFHSSERWQLIAISKEGNVMAVFPGCQVKAWIKCDEKPPGDCYAFTDI